MGRWVRWVRGTGAPVTQREQRRDEEVHGGGVFINQERQPSEPVHDRVQSLQ